jgi:glutamate dehydrogenase/leucine dehydrogenase
VIACIDAVAEHLDLTGAARSILIKGLGGIGLTVARRYVERGFRVCATEVRPEVVAAVKGELGGKVEFADEEDWGELGQVSLFSPNSSSGSLTRANLPVLAKLGVKAVVGGENNIRDKDVDADSVFRDHGILTFADFLLNGGGAWIVDAEMVERPVEAVEEWIRKYQVPTVIATIEAGRALGRSPESVFVEFIGRKVKELLA